MPPDLEFSTSGHSHFSYFKPGWSWVLQYTFRKLLKSLLFVKSFYECFCKGMAGKWGYATHLQLYVLSSSLPLSSPLSVSLIPLQLPYLSIHLSLQNIHPQRQGCLRSPIVYPKEREKKERRMESNVLRRTRACSSVRAGRVANVVVYVIERGSMPLRPGTALVDDSVPTSGGGSRLKRARSSSLPVSFLPKMRTEKKYES